MPCSLTTSPEFQATDAHDSRCRPQAAPSCRSRRGDAAKVRPHPLLDILVNPGFATLRAEDHVIVQRCEGVGHPWTIIQIAAKDDRRMVSLMKRVNRALCGVDEIGAIFD